MFNSAPKTLLSLSLAAAAALPAAAQAQALTSNLNSYRQANLVSDRPGVAKTTDPNLVNPWGAAFLPGGAFWISDNANGLSTLYTGQGNVIPAVFNVPAPSGQTTPASPTGIVINVTQGFQVPGTKLAANFIFSTEDGTISAWAGGLPTNPLNAVLAVDNSAGGTGAVYKGLAFGTTAAGNFIYATNFRAGTVDVFDSTFAPAGAKLLGSFKDPKIQAGYAPFGIQNINGNLFVTYALQNKAKHDDFPCAGCGYVDVFDTDGRLLQHFASGGFLNAPWGLALAPAGFGAFSNDILVGNFGSGAINAYDLNGNFRGQVENPQGRPLTISGLWGLYFGGAAVSTPDTLYFTAGPAAETHGLFGSIAPN
jgi:uncharacterized protein (TIGR03118 family)